MSEEIADARDPRIAAYLGLRDHIARQRQELPGGEWAELFMAEGDLVIERAMRAGYRAVSLLAQAGRPVPIAATMAADTAVYLAHPDVLTVITGRPKLRDPIACFARPALADAGDLVSDGTAFAVLENVTNPNNMGVIMRCAAGLGLDAVLLDPSCCDPLYRRSVRASMGEVFAIAHTRIEALPAGLDPLRDADARIIALTPTVSALPLAAAQFEPNERVAVMLGAEGPGLSALALASSVEHRRIPMAKGVDSLNVAAAAAIAFHAIGVGRGVGAG